MAPEARTRLGPYELQAPPGACRMGEVYRATDTRRDRTVAIKVLPSTLRAIWPGAKSSGNRSFVDHT
jgi:serine/threonine protein kinase, bacterial